MTAGDCWWGFEQFNDVKNAPKINALTPGFCVSRGTTKDLLGKLSSCSQQVGSSCIQELGDFRLRTPPAVQEKDSWLIVLLKNGSNNVQKDAWFNGQ